MATQTEMFRDALTGIADGPMMGSRKAVTAALMNRMAEKGCTLEQLTDRRMMNRSLYTLKKYAREFEIAFPDYVPMALREAKAEQCPDQSH